MEQYQIQIAKKCPWIMITNIRCLVVSMVCVVCANHDPVRLHFIEGFLVRLQFVLTSHNGGTQNYRLVEKEQVN